MAKKLDIGSVLAGAAKKKEKKSKSKTPHITIDDTDVVEAIDEYREAHKKEKDAKATMARCKAVITPVVEEKRLEVCKTDGFQSAIVVNEKMQVAVQNRYSAIAADDEDELRDIFGDETDRYFEHSLDISLTSKALQDEEILGKLIEAVGQENFAEYFDVKQGLKPTGAFHEDRATKASVTEKAQEAIDQGLVNPYSPSFKPV